MSLLEVITICVFLSPAALATFGAVRNFILYKEPSPEMLTIGYRDEANEDDDQNINRGHSGYFFKYTHAVPLITYQYVVTCCNKEEVDKLIANGYLETNVYGRLFFAKQADCLIIEGLLEKQIDNRWR